MLLFAASVSFLSVTLAANCGQTSDPAFDVQDAMALLWDFLDSSFDPPLDFPLFLVADKDVLYTASTAGVCISSGFLFGNTHDSQSDIVSAISDVISQCNTGSTSDNSFRGQGNLLFLYLPSILLS